MLYRDLEINKEIKKNRKIKRQRHRVKKCTYSDYKIFELK